jgi:hypothetical protein
MLAANGVTPHHATAHSINYTICATTSAVFSDNDHYEDAWRSDGQRPLSYASLSLRKDANCNWAPDSPYEYFGDGFADEDGCVSFTTDYHGCFVYTWRSYGYLYDTEGLSVYTSTGSLSQVTGFIAAPPQSTTPFAFSVPTNASARVYATFAYMATREFYGSAGGDTYVYLDDTACPVCGGGSSNRACAGDNNSAHVCLAETDEKFLMGHEYGHVNLWQSTSNSIVNDCSLNGSTHDFGSKEYISCAASEGWASFVALDIWNDHDANSNPEGYYWWDQASDTCTGPPDPYMNQDVIDQCPDTPDDRDLVRADFSGCWDQCVTQFMHNMHTGTFSGRGTEVDWMRAFWDYHTNDNGEHGTWVSHAQLQAQIQASGHLGPLDWYERLRIGVAASAGCDQYRRLVDYFDNNGADHCDGACADVPNCADCDSTGCPP